MFGIQFLKVFLILLEGVPIYIYIYIFFFFKGKQINFFLLLYIIFFFKLGCSENTLNSEWHYHYVVTLSNINKIVDP